MENKRKPYGYIYNESFVTYENFVDIVKNSGLYSAQNIIEAVPVFIKSDLENAFNEGTVILGEGFDTFEDYFKENYGI